MSRKYSSWAANQPLITPDLSMMRLMTVMGNEQDQLKNVERVEAIPHMYINVDAPPPPTSRIDARAMQPSMISRQSSSYFAAPTALPPLTNTHTKIWPVEKSSKHSSSLEHSSSTSKRHHKHKHHHHHHHHSDKHHHHHHSRKHRTRSAESIRNRQHQAVISPSKVIVTNPQYIEQDQQQQYQQQQQQQQQQQPMIVYREVPNGEGYTVDTNGLATVPYGFENETALADDQQAPMFVYREQLPQQQQQQQLQQQQQQQQSIMTDGLSQQVFFNPEQETFFQQSDPFVCLPQQQSSQIVYCTDSNQQDYLCASGNHNIIQQSTSLPSTQQQFVCLDNTSATMQPTIINQIPVFNPLSANTTSQSVVNFSQPALQRAASVIIQQPQPQQLQIIQQPQQLQVLQQPQQLQVFQQPQPLQIIQQPQTSAGQILQLAQPAQQVLQTMQPQVMQGQSVLQTIQISPQTVAANPQLLYQRPYDPVVIPVQNQQVAIAQPPLVALSQPSYAPSRIVSAAPIGGQPQGPNMFRHALLRTVADRTGVPVPGTPAAGIQLMQPTTGATLGSSPNLLLAGGVQRSGSLPIVPLTPGGLLIPFQPSQIPGLKPGPLPRTGGYPSTLRNFDDIRRQMDARRAQLIQSLQPTNYARIPSPPVISAAPRAPTGPYAPGNIFSSAARSGGSYRPPITPGSYTQPSFSGSTSGSMISTPYVPLSRP